MLRSLIVLSTTLTLSLPAVGAPTAKLVIAHRGASGYLPEHTLPSAAMAHAMLADYIEPDVVLTKDGVPVVLHDIHLEATTDVATLFPDRKRPDGRWYAIDFTLEEIRRLAVGERLDWKSGKPAFPGRFPADQRLLRVPTLEEMIRLVQGLNRSTGRTVGLYPEMKSPAFHTQAGQDIAKVVTMMLAQFGYKTKNDPLYLQCFDPVTLKYLRNDLKSQLKLVQLIGENEWQESDADYTAMRTEAGIKAVAQYADGIGPSIAHVFNVDPTKKTVTPSPLVAWAHGNGLAVHPYTVRADSLPAGLKSVDELHALLFEKAGVDGVFTDFTDKTVAYLAKKKK